MFKYVVPNRVNTVCAARMALKDGDILLVIRLTQYPVRAKLTMEVFDIKGGHHYPDRPLRTNVLTSAVAFNQSMH